jgi:putative addiction module component (TIGR02574 family)
MERDLRKMFREAFDLSESDRATLAGLLIESLEPPPDSDVEEAWAEEAQKRWRQIEAGTVQTIRWEEIRAKLFRRAERPSGSSRVVFFGIGFCFRRSVRSARSLRSWR